MLEPQTSSGDQARAYRPEPRDTELAPMEELAENMARLRDRTEKLAAHATGLAENLFGGEPTTEEDGPRPTGPGVVGELLAVQDSADRHVARIERALTRLSHGLGL